MAVQAQYPPSALFLNRSEPERNADMDFPKAPPPLFFPTNGVNSNPRKRAREPGSAIPMASPPPNQSNNLFSPYPTTPSMPASSSFVSLAQLQAQAPPLVSTGLRLSCDGQQQQQHHQQNPLVSSPSCSSTLLSSFLSDDLAAQIGHQRDEIDQFLLAQGEQLRRTLAERRRAHYRMLMGAAEESAARRLREKEAEVERAAKRSSELEDRLARLRTDSMAWQAKAMADQAAAASLHAQLQQAAAAAHGKAAEECGGESAPADDAESAHVDPERVEMVRPGRACRACRTRPVSVVLLPCRHLCLCSACDAAESACPVCRCGRTGSVQVFLS